MDLLCLGTAQPGQLEGPGCHRLMGVQQDEVAGEQGWGGGSGRMKGPLPSDQPETQGMGRGEGVRRGGEGRDGKEEAEASLPHPLP